MKLSQLERILDRARSKRIMVIGDLMLDEFVWGKVGRISPEAPVPVVEVTGESFYPGGAANVARNLREFVDHVALIGLFGKDHSGQQLRELLAEREMRRSRDSLEQALEAEQAWGWDSVRRLQMSSRSKRTATLRSILNDPLS